MLGVLNTDGSTPTPVRAVASTNIMKVSDGTTGTVTSIARAQSDANSVRTLTAVSNSDGTTLVTLAVNSSGQLLIQTT